MSPITGRVIVSDHDKNYPKAPQNHGWGNRLIIRPEDKEYAIILAHLSDATKRKVGTLIKNENHSEQSERVMKMVAGLNTFIYK